MKKRSQRLNIKHQQGVATLLVSIVLLIGVTLITIFTARVGVMDQRISANEYRHNEAKAAADAALDQAGAFIDINPELYEGTSANWSDCTTSAALQNTFPCTIGSTAYEKVYSVVSGTTISPLAYMTSLDNNILSDSYLVFTTSASAGNILTAVGKGSSLDGTADATNIISYAQVSLLTPGEIPPVMASVIDINGSFTIVADPNSGDKNGVPISAWVSSLDGAGTGSWQTCSLGSYKNGDDICSEEFYETETNNAGWGGCDCDTDDFLSSNSDIGYDIFEDTTNFPADVFGYVFNGASQAEVRQRAIAIGHRFDDCSTLDTVDLAGKPLVWIDGACTIPDDIGDRTNPIILVVDGLLKINSNHNVWGILVSTTDIQLSGGPIIHGSIVTDSNSKLSAGGYTQVYDPNVIAGLTDPTVNTTLSKLKYSWRNFTN